MTHRLSAHALGATLYMPATRTNIFNAIIENSIPGLKSLVICLEDAVSENDMVQAMQELSTLSERLAVSKQSNPNKNGWPLVFVRPRHQENAREIINSCDTSVFDGFVLPKFTEENMDDWFGIIAKTELHVMPTLETSEVYSVDDMTSLAKSLVNHPMRSRVLVLRIGGNDLMSVVSLRRPRGATLYDGPMGYVIKMLAAVFSTRGFFLTAPVFEHFDDLLLLQKELDLDVMHGLIGKTAIHPQQISAIQAGLMISEKDYWSAVGILDAEKAVYKEHGSMCEPATHRNWAVRMIERAKYAGVVGLPEVTGSV